MPPATDSHISVVVHYVATGRFPLSAGRWELLLDDGTLVSLLYADPTVGGRTLQNGDHVDLQASADVDDATTDVFVVYVDVSTSDLILAVPAD